MNFNTANSIDGADRASDKLCGQPCATLQYQDWMFFESSALWDAMAGTITFFLREGRARLARLDYTPWSLDVAILPARSLTVRSLCQQSLVSGRLRLDCAPMQAWSQLGDEGTRGFPGACRASPAFPYQIMEPCGCFRLPQQSFNNLRTRSA